MSALVVVDADVLGRRRTGDETYVLNLLRELGSLAPAAGIRIAATTRRPDLVPDGIEPVALDGRSQELRLAFTLPRLLRRLRASLVHTQHVLPLRSPCPSVVTIHDLSFVRRPELMSRRDRLVFQTMVPRAVRRAARVLAVSERTKRDLVELYGVGPDKVVVTPNGVDPAFHPASHPASHAARQPESPEAGKTSPSIDQLQGPYVLAVGAIQSRKNHLQALAAASETGMPLVVVGPEKDKSLAEELRRRGARLVGYVDTERLAELYRGAACLVQASTYEGFGLPVVEAMASGTPVVAVREPALEEVAGDAAIVIDTTGLADGIRRALAERERLVAAGLERARSFSWRRSAELTLEVYLEALGMQR